MSNHLKIFFHIISAKFVQKCRRKFWKCVLSQKNILPELVVQLLILYNFATSWTVACQASQSITISQSLLNFMYTESVMPSNHLILCRPLLLLSSVTPNVRVYFKESALCIRCSKYWSFSLSISPFNEHSGLISIRIDWFDLLAVQGTLKSLL